MWAVQVAVVVVQKKVGGDLFRGKRNLKANPNMAKIFAYIHTYIYTQRTHTYIYQCVCLQKYVSPVVILF